MAQHYWTCQRVQNRTKCAHVNPKRRQICERCGKRRPKTKRPAHRAALDVLDYDACVELFGERCGICGAEPAPGKKLHRDHEHKGDGLVRGLLCFRCNILLPKRADIEWLERTLAYLQRAERLRDGSLIR